MSSSTNYRDWRLEERGLMAGRGRAGGRLRVRGASQVVTLRGPARARRRAEMRELGIVPGGEVWIEDGAFAGPGGEAEELDAGGRVVLPGFVDSHTHRVFAGPRLLDYEMRIAGASYPEIAAAGGGILASVRALREAPPETLEAQARKFLGWMAAHGTTTVEAKTGYGLDEAGEIRTLELLRKLDQDPLDIVPTYLGAHVAPPEYGAAGGDAYVAFCGQVMERARGLAKFADIYCEPGAFTVAQARAYLEQARRAGLGLKVHAEQFTASGGARLAVEMGAVSADHLESADEDAVRALAESATVATLLPGSVFHLGLERYAPARALIDAGAAVALATDFNPGTSPTCSMLMALSLACTQMRMTPAEAVSAATINGACAAGQGREAGSIETGKRGDLVILNVSDYREIPYYFGVNLVHMTIKRGAPIYIEGGAPAWQER